MSALFDLTVNLRLCYNKVQREKKMQRKTIQPDNIMQRKKPNIRLFSSTALCVTANLGLPIWPIT